MLLKLPTGAGKTVIAAILLARIMKSDQSHSVLILAHRSEIIDQTAMKLSRHLPNIPIEIEQGRRRVEGKGCIVLASIQSMVRRKESFDPKAFSIIICDECHHALAPSWLAVIRYFQSARSDMLLVGMSATPVRSDGHSVESLFGQVAFEIERCDLQDMGYLVPIEYFTVKAQLNLDRVARSAGDFQVTPLTKVMNSEKIRVLTIQAWLHKGRGLKTIVFCAGVEHAHQLAADFSGIGATAAAVDGWTQDRDDVLKKFRDGKIKVLTNYGVLTEGFDDPSIRCVIMARPTTSPLVYSQCLGRGLRPHTGKMKCVVIDVVDRSTHHLQYSATQLAGLPTKWRAQGGDPFRDCRAMRKIQVTDPGAYLEIQKATSLRQVQEVLMKLPAETVLAGLDGKPVVRYPLKEEGIRCLGVKESTEIAMKILTESFISFERMRVTRENIQVSFRDIEKACREHGYIKWHIFQATGRNVIFLKSRNRKSSDPLRVLKSLLKKGQRLKTFRYENDKNKVTAMVSGMSEKEFRDLRLAFESKIQAELRLMGEVTLF